MSFPGQSLPRLFEIVQTHPESDAATISSATTAPLIWHAVVLDAHDRHLGSVVLSPSASHSHAQAIADTHLAFASRPRTGPWAAVEAPNAFATYRATLVPGS